MFEKWAGLDVWHLNRLTDQMQLSRLQDWRVGSLISLKSWRTCPPFLVLHFPFWVVAFFCFGRHSEVYVVVGQGVGARLHPPRSDPLLMRSACGVSWTSNWCQHWSGAFLRPQMPSCHSLSHCQHLYLAVGESPMQIVRICRFPSC